MRVSALAIVMFGLLGACSAGQGSPGGTSQSSGDSPGSYGSYEKSASTFGANEKPSRAPAVVNNGKAGGGGNANGGNGGGGGNVTPQNPATDAGNNPNPGNGNGGSTTLGPQCTAVRVCCENSTQQALTTACQSYQSAFESALQNGTSTADLEASCTAALNALKQGNFCN